MIIEAFHMIGFSNLDQGRILHPEYHAEILVNIQARYEQIVRTGVLRPASFLEKLLNT